MNSARSDSETLFDTMIANVLKDGRTRRLDGYLELALKIHGSFAAVLPVVKLRLPFGCE